ncbi:MAG: ketoacyl-ACP synthase III [Balneolaceae bacterium]|nr:MAG: ketoacyl-ACP synthase III [Balneolaceae bacterium]
MALLKYQNAGITGITAAVPANLIDNLSYTDHFENNVVKKIVEKIGIYKRRFVKDGTCSSDLCYAAAEALFQEMDLDRSKVDMVLFVSQTPDYRMPATSILLQHRLGLSRDVIAFDINLGCSAFVFALQTSFSYLQNTGINKVLILNGETRSKVYSPKDRKTAFIFGDAGAAILVEKDEKFGNSFFSLNSDGSKSSFIKMDGGGYRNPSTIEGLREKVVDEYGNIRNDEQGYMDGESVFSFFVNEIPIDIKRILKFSSMDIRSIDYFVFHQASKIVNDYLIRKLKLNSNKVPKSYPDYGNTSSVSVPLTMVTGLKDKLAKKKILLLSAFGVGFSWASAIIQTQDCFIGTVTEI